MILVILYYLVLFVCFCKFVILLLIRYCKSNVCLIGKTVLVTGGNSGMGYQLCLNLASRGARVIIADVADTTTSVKTIKEKTKNENIASIHLDLSSFDSIRKFVEKFFSQEQRLDILINNAGCAGHCTYTDDGIDKVMQINYLGPFLLTHLLTPLLKQSKESRVVFVSSMLAYMNNLSSAKDLNRLSKPKNIQLIFAYGNSKLCILAAAKIFARRLSKHGIIVSSSHPGLVNTNIFATSNSNATKENKADLLYYISQKFVTLMVRLFSITIHQGIQPTLHCALSSHIQPGDFITDGANFRVPSKINDEKFITEIWDESVRLSGLSLIEE